MLQTTSENIKRVWDILFHVWDRKLSRNPELWDASFPGHGLDDITALVVQDLFGGRIMVTTTEYGEDPYRLYYNHLTRDDGFVPWDFTGMLNIEPDKFMPIHRDALVALCHTRYHELKGRVYTEINYSADSETFDISLLRLKHADVIQVRLIELNDPAEGVYLAEDAECIE